MIKTYYRDNPVKLSANFNSKEFFCKCGCNSALIDEKLITYLQLIREHFGAPITITSGYRCNKHNEKVGGASKSKHKLGQAADIKVKGVEPKEVAKYAESIGIKGIGLYDTFTHIDTRTTKSFWYGSNNEYRSTFGASVTNSSLDTASKITIALPTLRSGKTNKAVKVLQTLLEIAVTGTYDERTKAAVIEFQKKSGLIQDGIAGAKTWSALFN
jgi:peptidoglycan hydrolase-like protein with peptidoglycan-binding domain